MDWAGVIAGVATPMHEDESIDWTSLEAHLESFAGCGLAGVVVNADTGEGALLTPDEREAVLWFAVRGVEAIKESSWSPARFAESAEAFAGGRHDVALLSGQDSFILDSLVLGADGAMLAAAATDAGAYATMWAQRGTAAAVEIQA